MRWFRKLVLDAACAHTYPDWAPGGFLPGRAHRRCDAAQHFGFSPHAKRLALKVYTHSPSYPSGLNVSVNGGGVGKTSVSVTPGYTNNPYVGTISGPSANYSVCYSQLLDGNHTVYYNAQADTNGQIGSISSALVADDNTYHPSLSTLVRRTPNTRIRNGFDRSRIQVHFVSSAIGGDERIAGGLERTLGAAHAYTLGPVGNTMDRIVFVPRGQSAQSLAAAFRRLPQVADARLLPLRYTQSGFFPNDTYFDNVNQWDMYHIDTPDAWGIVRGSVPIAIVDTGADLTAHDLGQNISYEVKWVGSEPPYPNRSAGAAQDQDGHGTNVSGIADAVTNNAFGFVGVGFNAPLQVYRIFPTPVAPNYTSASDYGASTADEAAAIGDAVAHGAKVINLSLGSCPSQDGGPDPTEFDAIERAISSGVVVVAAAGNERAGGSSCGTSNTIDFPAAYPGVIAVGATSLRGNPSNPSGASEYVSSYSNSGPGLAVVAPGGDPTSASDQNLLHWITNLYSSTVADPSQRCQPHGSPPLCAALFAGTSQATPHVVGTVALMRSVNRSIGPPQVKNIIESTTENLNDPNQGFGRVDTYRAVAAAAGIKTGAPAPNPLNFRAIAYTVTHGSNRPRIWNVTFPAGVPVQSNGSFRVADILTSTPSFKIGLWNDANGNGIVDAGDYFGSAGPCTGNAPCSAAGSIDVSLVKSGFVLK